MKETPEWINELKQNEIFVFGSNESGRHGKGAAKQALKWGACYGQPKGLQGRTYGIPTVNGSISNKLSIEKIARYVREFADFALNHPSLTFLVTEIGCGLAGHSVNDIAPLFACCIDLPNVCLPRRFIQKIKSEKEIVA